MPKKRMLQLRIVFLGLSGLFVIVTLIVFIINLSMVRDWQIRQSISVIEGSRHIFDNSRQFSGNYKQKSFFYWSAKQISEVKQFYQDFTITPFLEVNSYGGNWSIAAWRGSKIIENPIRKAAQLHTDLCDYHGVYDCMSIVLLDTSQVSLPNILGGMYSTSTDEIQSLPKNGTLIVFSYNTPDPA